MTIPCSKNHLTVLLWLVYSLVFASYLTKGILLTSSHLVPSQPHSSALFYWKFNEMNPKKYWIREPMTKYYRLQPWGKLIVGWKLQGQSRRNISKVGYPKNVLPVFRWAVCDEQMFLPQRLCATFRKCWNNLLALVNVPVRFWCPSCQRDWYKLLSRCYRFM